MAVNKELKDVVGRIKFEFGLNQAEIAKKLDVKSTYLSDMINGRVPFSENISNKIYELFHITVGTGVNKKSSHGKNKSNKIPLYDDVQSIGGRNGNDSDMQGVSKPTEHIDAGDWFNDATAAIRHFGESMNEYPPGCILAIKEVQDKRLIIPGRDYVIETSEYRVTKRVQLGESCIRAHSTNDEKYDDGTLIHQPFDIPFDLIKRIYLVLGYVVKKNGDTIVFNNKN